MPIIVVVFCQLTMSEHTHDVHRLALGSRCAVDSDVGTAATATPCVPLSTAVCAHCQPAAASLYLVSAVTYDYRRTRTP